MRFPSHNKYPKKVYVTNECYAVLFVKNFPHYGETDPVKHTIKIKAGMSPRETFATFLHELLHAAEFEYDIKIKHRTVHELERALVEIIIDNFID